MSDDFKEYYQAALHFVLASPGLTEAEYKVMSTIVAFDSATPSGLARTISKIEDEELNEPRYREAVETLLEKRYACILDAEQIARMRATFAQETIPALNSIMFDNRFHPGEVDLTERGYLVYRDITMKVYGPHHVYCNEAGWVDNEHGIVKVYAVLEWAMYTRVGQAVLALTEENKQIQAVHRPVSIGKWRPNRFMTYPSGGCVVIEYKAEEALPSSTEREA